MNYIYITPFFPSTVDWSGGYSLDFVRALMRHGNYHVSVFVPGNGSDYEIGGVKVYRFPERKLPSNIFPFLFARWNRRNFLRKVALVLSDLGSVKIAHANTANCGIYALAVKERNSECLTLLHHHDLASFGLNTGILHRCWLYNLIQYPILRRMHEAIDCHIFISEASRRSFLNVPNTDWSVYEDYKKQYRGLGFYRSPKIKKSIVLHNGVDVETFRQKKREKRGDEFVIGCIANFWILKDQETLIKAVEAIRRDGCETKIKVIFVGTGPTLESCKALAASSSLAFEFRTEVPHAQLVDFYHELDLFVLPSYFEGFGCVYTEAWCCGVPFIACEGQGIEDVIAPEDRHLWLAKPRDVKDLAAKICCYMNSCHAQKLCLPVDIDTLVQNFIQEINQ